MDKKSLRLNIIESRKNISQNKKDEASINVILKLIDHKKFKSSNIIGIYYPLDIEIDLLNLINMFPNKTFALPKIVNDELIFLKIDKSSELVKNKFNIYEIHEGEDISQSIEFFIVPALAMTKNNYRLGFGKGYYDKFFKKHSNSYKIGIIYKNEIKTFKIEEHDVPLDGYIQG